jgi:AraC family transcriptional regulator
MPKICASHHIVCLPIKRPEVIEVVSEEYYQTAHRPEAHGVIELYPANAAYQVRWVGETEFVHCYLDPKYLANTAYQAGYSSCVEILLHFVQHDPLIYEIGLALKKVLETHQSNRLYIESLTTALSAHILQHYSIQRPNLNRYVGRLSQSKLQQVIDYISDRLDQNLSLVDLAAVVQMSTHHFARSFKASTGTTPHQYVVQRRIEKAKQLLMQWDLMIADVCQAVGFHNQSNFTTTFRKLVGVTPRQYRQSL